MKWALVGFVFLIFLPFSAGAQGCAPDLVSYWSFDDDFNDVCNLFSTNVYGSVSRVDANMGKAASFNGQEGNYIFAETQSNKITTDLTAMTWFKTTNEVGMIINKHSTHYQLRVYLSRLKAQVVTDHPSGGNSYTIYSVISNQNVNDNVWHHAALTFETDDNKIKLYLDGELVGETDTQGKILNYTEKVFFGGYNWDPSDPEKQCCYLNGEIDEVKIYDRALSQEEICDFNCEYQVVCNPNGTDHNNICRSSCGSSNECDGHQPGYLIPSCLSPGTKTYHHDMCDNNCQNVDRDSMCLKRGHADCTGDPECHLITAGTNSCDNECNYTSENVYADLNGDGNVDIYDLTIVTSSFGQTDSHPEWNATADVFPDNVIDIYDLVFIIRRFGNISGSGLKILDPGDGIYLGAYDWTEFDGNPGIAEFETAIGKKVAISSAPCGCPEGTICQFDINCHEQWYQNGYITAVGLEFGDPKNPDPSKGWFTSQQVIEGGADQLIKDLAEGIKNWGRPVFWLYKREPSIQPGYGYDGGGYGPTGQNTRFEVSDLYGQYNSPHGTSCNNPGDEMCLDGPERYRDMCRHIHDVVEGVVPDQITWVMGAIVNRVTGGYELYYPGDAYVDWHALDVYPYVLTPEGVGSPYIMPFAQNIEPAWSEALSLNPNKPFMFLEFGVYHHSGITEGGPCDFDSPDVNTIDRTAWFNDFFQKVKTTHTQLGAFMYWQMGEDAFDCANTRIRTTDPVAQPWQQEMQDYPDFWLSEVKTG